MNLLTELRRRNVFRMAVLYVVSAWLVLQVGDVLFGVLGVPDWSLRLLLAFLALGFPFALIFSWIYELTPEGVKKESEVDRTTSVTPQTGRKIDRLIIVVLAIAVVVLLVDRWRFTESDPVSTAETRTASAPETDAGQAADVRSIAVLPFADFSGGDDQAWFARGLAEEILNALARTPDLMVAARTSSFRYTDSELPVTEIAQELGVAHVLEGSVRRAPDRIRVTAQLIRAEDGFHLWSENYDRDSDDIIAIQEDIARSIAIALETAMDPDALAAMMSAGTRSVEAYDTYLKALAEAGDSWADGTYDVQQAVENLERSVRLDPTFARAHEFLSLQYRGLANTSIMSRSAEDKTPAEYRERFEAAIEAAIRHASNEVDRTYYEAIKANAEQRLALSQDRYRAYLDARPNDARAITEYAGILIARGDLTAARGALEPIVSGAVQSSWPTRLQAGNLLLFSGSPDEGIALFDQILATDPDNAGALYEKHRALLWPQRFEEASQVVEEMRRAPPMPAHQQENVAIREACAAGDRDAAEALLNAMGPDHPFGRWYGALLLGYKDRAATALAPMDETEAGLDDLAGYLVFPHFDPSPYPRLMARIGNDLVREKPIVETLPFACPPAERPSVAVLPFTTRSRNEDDLFFSDGVHDDLLTQLAKIGGLKVISRTSVMEYRDTPKNLREIGDELGAAHIVEGAVQRAGDTVRITAQLIDADTDEHLWAESYDRTLTAENLFEIQTEIAKSIAAALETTLTPEEIARLGRPRTSSLEALAHYQRAYRSQSALDLDAFERIDDALEKALALDPDFAAAYAFRARTTLTRYWIIDQDPALAAAALDDIEKARALEPELPEAAVAEGYYHYWVNLDYGQALAVLDPLREAYPNDPDVLGLMSWVNRRQGRADLAVSQLQRALDQDPRDPDKWASLGRTMGALLDYDAAEFAIERLGELDANAPRLNELRAMLALDRDGDVRASGDHWAAGIGQIPYAPPLAWRAYLAAEDWSAALAIATMDIEGADFLQLEPATMTAITRRLAGEADAIQALEAARDAALPLPEDPVKREGAILSLCLLDGMLGNAEDADRNCRAAIEETRPDVFSEANLNALAAEGLAQAGLNDAAFERLEIAIASVYPRSRNSVRLNAFLTPLHDDPRWADLLERAPE